jgi:hypothetical protein
LAIDLFHYLFGATNIGPRRSCRIQGLPPEDLEEYTPFLPNSPEVSPEEEVNKNVASEIGSSTPLEESILPVNLLLSVVHDPLLLQINSSGDVVAEDYNRILIGPHIESGVDDPLFQSESFRTLVHTARNFDPISSGPIRSLWRISSGQHIFEKLGLRHLCQRTSNQIMESHMPMTSTAYTIPLYHFTGTTNNVVAVSDQLLVSSHTILPLHLTSSTMVPQTTLVSAKSIVVTRALIGTPLPLRPNP